MAISQALKEIYASAPADQRYIETLNFLHSNFSAAHYFTNDLQPWRFNTTPGGDRRTFDPFPFRIVLPSNDGQGNQDLQIAITNIGRRLMDELAAANEKPSEPITAIYRVYLNQPNSDAQNDPPLELTITDIEGKRAQVTAVARRADILNRPFPRNVYRVDKFPGLDR